MRCTNCDHALWNQPLPPAGSPRLCPECGTPYRAADFEYGRGKVRFCCPNCETGYYGTSRAGHLEPASFQCVGCSAELTMDACIIRPHDFGREQDAMQRTEVPWLSRRGEGGVRRWWSTCTLGLANSSLLARRLGSTPRLSSATVFLLINAAVASFLGTMLTFGSTAFLQRGLPGGVAGSDFTAILMVLAGMLAATFGFVLVAAIPAACVALLHSRGKPLGFGRAYELVAYSSGGLLVSIVPCCGLPLGYFLWLVTGSQALASAIDSRRGGVAASILAVVGFLVAGAIPIVLIAALA